MPFVDAAEASGQFSSDTRFLECTGGSTGTSLAFVCAVKGHHFTVISSDAYAREKLDSMRAFGAELLVEPSVGGVVTPDLWPRMQARAARLVESGDYLYLDQFRNPHAATGYQSMGQEILDQLPGRIDAFCGAVGTAGMIMGVGGKIRERDNQVRIVALEPDSSPVLSGGQPGPHGVDGTAAGFVPPMFSRETVTEVSTVTESRARQMACALAREEGIFAGTSTGLNLVAALELAREIGPGGNVVTVACDTGFKYLDGPLYQQ